MNEIKKKTNDMGWRTDNSYLSLPEYCYSKARPASVQDPLLILKNTQLAEELSLSLDEQDDQYLAKLFCGNIILEGTTPIAQAYAGHQFGNFTMLGDGRAHMLFEHTKANGQKVDVQLKGSGRTPYSKTGDGKGAMGPMLREYLISEAMNSLGIPTSRSLAVVSTGEPVFRKTIQPGAILTRVATCHLRVGSFQYLLALKEPNALKQMADFAIERHYPEIKDSDQPYLDFLDLVIGRQIDLVVNWMRIGFIHGVMNTDNMTISGETIDYGPCAFMDAYDANTVFSSIDTNGRYAFANQGPVANWNLARFAETLIPLIDEQAESALSKAQDLIIGFNDRFQAAWLEMMRKKLGLYGQEAGDIQLIDTLLTLMSHNNLDYTNTFRALLDDDPRDKIPLQSCAVNGWWERWKERRIKHLPSPDASVEMLKANNPARIPRNHKVEEALEYAELKEDLSKVQRLLEAFKNPYEDLDEFKDLTEPAKPDERVYQTFCGT